MFRNLIDLTAVKMETDHIIPAGENRPDTIDNAIPLCFAGLDQRY